MINKIGLIGLGYVGLPLAFEFGKKFNTVGFDINENRVNELNNYVDRTQEVNSDSLRKVLNSGRLLITNKSSDLINCDVYIITVPTPVDKNNRPVLNPLLSASKLVGGMLKKGDVVIYESTVYPGVTEDECVPVLCAQSGLTYNKDFFVGYSPERINPGDKKHTLTKIVKITSGSTPLVADFIDKLYNSILSAGTHRASSIKVAEAAKVIENAQRDINIAFVNELSKIFSKLQIDTSEVLEASSTKWNFLQFKPGLVGGHCIGVDPYYLAHKAQEVGYHPEIILAGRRINDSMGKHVATEAIKLMIRKNVNISGARALILGFAFKENCPDFRNTKVIDIYNELLEYNMEVDVYDPWVSSHDVELEYGFKLLDNIEIKNYRLIILAVAHQDFVDFHFDFSKDSVLYDVKGFLDRTLIDGRL
jgi:UDP-N-acetyl-D-glucosamine/UDP-N-acetyl-D-galactosamine dehydrogenase